MGIQITVDQISKENTWYDIEETIVDACYQIDDDSRMMSLLFSWVQVHGKYILADKLIKRYWTVCEIRGECHWFYALCAFAKENKIHKLSKEAKKQASPVYLQRIPKSAVKMKGPIPYLKDINIFIPQGSIRLRETDVLGIKGLAKRNIQFRNRVLFGANWRADIITALQWGLGNPYQISKKLNCSYESVYRITKEYNLIKEIGS